MSSESSALLIRELGSCSSLASRGLGLNALSQNERWIVIISRIRRNRGIEIKPFLSEIDNKTLRTDAMFSVLFPVGGFYCFCVWTQGKSWKEISCLRLKKKNRRRKEEEKEKETENRARSSVFWGHFMESSFHLQISRSVFSFFSFLVCWNSCNQIHAPEIK